MRSLHVLQLSLELEQALFISRLHQLRGERVGGEEEGREAPLASGEPERQRHMGLAGSAVAECDDILAAGDILAADEFQRQHPVEAGDGGKIESVEALDRGELSFADAPLGDAALAVEKLELDEAEQVADVVDAVAGGLARDLLVFAQDRRQFELLEMMSQKHGGHGRRLAGGGRVGLGCHAALPESSMA